MILTVKTMQLVAVVCTAGTIYFFDRAEFLFAAEDAIAEVVIELINELPKGD